VAAVVTPQDIVIRPINIAVVAAPMLPVFIVAARSQEVALLSEAELLGARTSPTAVADGVGNSDPPATGKHRSTRALLSGWHRPI